ncbi:hypothetical protein EYB26_008467 [Talaromyces marneffei]|uniref:uncharacterized protein n=1 Tax=Talaromyces marneffei TaxID=37727 RepID=UPI0012A96C44|nr:uncharacterized protein EYB26_008467 [Talaromyces marneffei]QGA20759.1 hypothetical protein EYB26_008467 [Talaromyces marneffei]
MVYRGKPSKSCRNCRRRDIKCDRKLNGCSQCSRANISCPGYPNPSDLIICDETSSTIDKRRRAEISLISPHSFTDSIPARLLPSIEIHAKNLFISQYVADTDKANLFTYMRVFWPPGTVKFPLLSTVVKAVWLAFFSFSHQSSPALHDARVNYGSALMLTTTAIQSPTEAKENSTLMSLLLLSVYERLVYWEGNIIPSNAHLRGALGLVLYRGGSQFSDPIRMNMLLGLCEFIILDCLAHETDIPQDLLILKSRVMDDADLSPKWRFLELLLEYAQLKEMQRYGVSPAMLISEAVRLMSKLEDISHVLPPFACRKDMRRLEAASITHPDHNTRRSWNNIRIIRVLLADIIREQCTKILGDLDITDPALINQQLQECICIIVSPCSEICSFASGNGIIGTASQNVSSVQISTLFFHLYAAYTFAILPLELKQLLHQRLRDLSEGQFPGIQRLMNQLLRETSAYEKNFWKVWLRLGKENFSI